MSAVVHLVKSAPGSQEVRPAVPKPRQSTLRRGLVFIAREPFFQFLVLGLLIWTAVASWQSHESRYIIHIDPAERQRIAESYLQQFGQMPSAEKLHSLIDRSIREEIFLREGLAHNLDKDDEIVRRRIVQKYEFLQTDLAVGESPSADALQRWFEQNEARYLTPQTVAFSQVYFSTDRDGEQAAKERAAKALGKLRASLASRAPDLGDAFPGPSDVGTLAPEEAARLFGESELSQKLFRLPVGQWSGPFRSGYGWHLVYLTGHMPPDLRPLTQIQERVLADYKDEQRRLSNARNFEKLRAQYTVRYDGARP